MDRIDCPLYLKSRHQAVTSIQEIAKSDRPDLAFFGSYTEVPAFTDSPTIVERYSESTSQEDFDGDVSEWIPTGEFKGVGEEYSTSELLEKFNQNADIWLESEHPLRKNESQIIFAIYRLYLRNHKDNEVKNQVLSLSGKMFWRFDRLSLYLQLFPNDPDVEDFLLEELATSPYDFIKACCWRCLANVAPNKYADRAIEIVCNSSCEYTLKVEALEYIVKQSSFPKNKVSIYLERLFTLLKTEGDYFFAKILLHHLLAMTEHFKRMDERSRLMIGGLEHSNDERARVAYLNSTEKELEVYREESAKQRNLNQNIRDSVLSIYRRLDIVCMKIGLLPQGKKFDFHKLLTEEGEYSEALDLLNQIHSRMAIDIYWNGACADIWKFIRVCVCATVSCELGITIKDYDEVCNFQQLSYVKHAIQLEEYDSKLKNKNVNHDELETYKQMARNVIMAIIKSLSN